METTSGAADSSNITKWGVKFRMGSDSQQQISGYDYQCVLSIPCAELKCLKSKVYE